MPGIKVEVDGDGRTKFLYEGFKGEMCFKEAQKILANLKALGVDADVCEVKRTQEQQAKEAIRGV